MSNIRELRLSLEQKLTERRVLLTKNTRLQSDLRGEVAQNGFLCDALRSPLVKMEMERCADDIVNAVLDHALRASRAVAAQTMESGDYEVGISIPSFHIRRVLFRPDWSRLDGPGIATDQEIRRITYNATEG